VRLVSELAYEDYIKNELPNDEFLGEMVREKLIYYPTVTREAFKHTGRLTTAIENGQLFKDIGLPPLDPANDRGMICGSPSMLKEISEMLDAKGFNVSPSSGRLGDYVYERAFVEK
jgi:ferredoxin--NADP+ reductase